MGIIVYNNLVNIVATIFKQTSWQIIGKIITSFATFIILGIVARNYGENGTGVFTLALTYLAIFYLLADFGFNAHVLTSVKSKGFRVEKDWNKLLGTRILWSIFLVLIAIATLPIWLFATVDFKQAILFGSLAIIGAGIFNTCNLIFQSRLRYDLSVLSVSFGTFVSLGLFIYLTSNAYPIPFLLLAHLSGWILIALASLFAVKNFLPKLNPIFDLQYIKHLFLASWPIAATLTLNVIYFRADSFMIAYFKGVSDAGIYNIAYSVFQSVLVIPTFIMNSYFPLMLKSLKGLKLVGLGLFLLSLLASITTLLFAPFIIKILTGSGFSGSTASLQILSLGFPAYFLSSILMWLLVTKAKYKLMLVIYLAGLIVNTILNLIYIPQFSFLAASWITVISEYLILLMQIIVLLRYTRK